MAIIYCNLYSGNDSDDGLTSSTPKLTINAATALVTSVNDEVRVRGKDDMFYELSIPCTWTNNSRFVTCIGNLTSELAAGNGNYICKMVSASGNTVPEYYLVSAISYNAGTNTTTITLGMNTTFGIYYGETETVTTYSVKFNTVANQSINKDGFYSGDINDISGRTLTNISGGWNSDYTLQTSYTLMYNTTSGLFNFNSKLYWKLSRFLVTTTSTPCYNINTTNIELNTCGGGNCGARVIDGTASNIYINNCFFLNCTTQIIFRVSSSLFVNSKMILCSGSSPLLGDGSGNILDNCVIGLGTTAGLFNNVNNIYNSTLLFNNASLSPQSGGNLFNIYNSTIIDYTTTNVINYIACNIYDSTFNVKLNRGSNTYRLQTITSAILNNSIPTLKNIVSLDSNIIIKFNNGNLISLTNFQLDTLGNQYTVDNLKWFNNNNQTLNLSGLNTNQLSDKNCLIMIYDVDGNPTRYTIYGGTTTLSTDSYNSGINSIKHSSNTVNGSVCEFSNVDFNIIKTNTYNLSFYVKSNSNLSFEYNFYNGGEYIYDTWLTANSTTSWSQITATINSASWKSSGMANLTIRFAGPSKELLVDNIILTTV